MFSLKDIKETGDMDANLITRNRNLELMNQFENIRIENPHLTQPQICKMMNISVSTIERYRKDLDMRSPFRHKIPRKTNSDKLKYV